MLARDERQQRGRLRVCLLRRNRHSTIFDSVELRFFDGQVAYAATIVQQVLAHNLCHLSGALEHFDRFLWFVIIIDLIALLILLFRVFNQGNRIALFEYIGQRLPVVELGEDWLCRSFRLLLRLTRLLGLPKEAASSGVPANFVILDSTEQRRPLLSRSLLSKQTRRRVLLLSASLSGDSGLLAT